MKKLTPIMFILLITLLGCNNPPSSADASLHSETQNSSLDSAVHFLLDVSAKDFYDHQNPLPVSFRNVEVRNLTGQDTENLYMICGQFLTKDNGNEEVWTSFATIKTYGYEQWIGKQSLSYCQDSKTISYKIKDLSSVLKSRVDSLHNLKDLTE